MRYIKAYSREALAIILSWLVAASLVGWLLLGSGGCDRASVTQQAAPALPVVELAQVDAGRVEIRVAGPEGLRALQAKLVYDAGSVQIESIEPGEQTRRLDRVFFSDPKKAAGSLVLGVSDTRRVRLPARGSLLQLSLSAKAGARLELTEVLGVRQGAAGPEAVALADATLEIGQ